MQNYGSTRHSRMPGDFFRRVQIGAPHCPQLGKSPNLCAAAHFSKWKFSTELSPWQGGGYERMVDLTKVVL